MAQTSTEIEMPANIDQDYMNEISEFVDDFVDDVLLDETSFKSLPRDQQCMLTDVLIQGKSMLKNKMYKYLDEKCKIDPMYKLTDEDLMVLHSKSF